MVSTSPSGAARMATARSQLSLAVDMLERAAEGTPIASIFKQLSLGLRTVLNSAENRDNRDSAELLERIHGVVSLLVSASEQAFSESLLEVVAGFAQTLHEIAEYLETVQENVLDEFLKQHERTTKLEACRRELQAALDVFQAHLAGSTLSEFPAIENLEADQHAELLELVDLSSDTGDTDSVWLYSEASTSDGSLSLLPSRPQIFHGRDSELSHLLGLFSPDLAAPRIAILGPGGIGKTSLAKELLHAEPIQRQFGTQARFFVSCEAATRRSELAGLVAAQIGMLDRPQQEDATSAVMQHLRELPGTLLVLDNFETIWEAEQTRGEAEEFLALLTEVEHLALIVTMRGAERPAQVQWTRPFFAPLKPLSVDAARELFYSVADDLYEDAEVLQLLQLTDNVPLPVTLIAHLVDIEGSCAVVLHRWDKERTSMLADGYDRRSNLEMSISISLSSPRMTPSAIRLLSLLSILPDGLSDAELCEANVGGAAVLHAKTTLLRTSLAYMDIHNRLKVLVPIREYVEREHPPLSVLFLSLLRYYTPIIRVYDRETGVAANGTSRSPSAIVTALHANAANIQNILLRALLLPAAAFPLAQRVTALELCFAFDLFSRRTGRGETVLMSRATEFLPRPCIPHLEVRYAKEVLNSFMWKGLSRTDAEELIQHASGYLPHVEDANLKCHFYAILGTYYSKCSDPAAAARALELGLALATETNNLVQQAKIYLRLAWTKWQMGQYRAGCTLSQQAQRAARKCGDLEQEGQALRMEAILWHELGEYSRALGIIPSALDALERCGLGDTPETLVVLSSKAEIHAVRTEYAEAQAIYVRILQSVSPTGQPYMFALHLLNLAGTRTSLGDPRESVQADIDVARRMFTKIGHERLLQFCDLYEADIRARDGEVQSAVRVYEAILRASAGHDVDLEVYALERLVRVPEVFDSTQRCNWAVLLLVRGITIQRRIATCKGLQALAECTAAGGDGKSAEGLLMVARDGFWAMGVHECREECSRRLKNIAE
ncbi:hypothetical protein MKEN_00157200 [Mycena kentingensis (nom. inval.)]|nr:hypothetical protein MKEN_00157200 [Mycena kentingensis (nom. inval.)]